MILLSIDPGNSESAFATYDTEHGKPLSWQKIPNTELLYCVENSDSSARRIDHLAIEMVACYGMAVGAEVFDTCVWIGRFIQAWGGPFNFIYRKDVKLHLCGNLRAKDANIRQALIDRFGPGKELAIGRKASPGPLYGMSGDCWSALAVAVTHADSLVAESAGGK